MVTFAPPKRRPILTDLDKELLAARILDLLKI